MRNLRIWTLLLAAVGALAPGCISSSSLPPPVKVNARTSAQYVAKDIGRPGAIAAADDGRVFFTEKDTGVVRIIVDGELRAEPFAQVPVNNAGERGLLGIALHPDFARNARVYVFYTRSDTGDVSSDPQAVIDNRVVYFVASGEVAAGGEIFVASLPAGGTTSRLSGRLAFDTERRLYVALGDLGEDAAPQADDALGGKVLRYSEDGSIPADNPSAGSAVFARGLRDVTAFVLEPNTNVIFAADDNSGGNDEINRIARGGNYGWPSVAGAANTAAEQEFVAATPSYVDPILSTDTQNPDVSGLAFNPSAKYGAESQDQLFYAERSSGRIQRVRLAGDRIAVEGREVFAENLPVTVRDLVFTPGGTLYVAGDGAVLRLVPTR